jgi:hypothetical protein
MELDEAGDLGQLGVAAQPHLLEVRFGAFFHVEAVHGNEHHLSPGPGQDVTVNGWHSPGLDISIMGAWCICFASLSPKNKNGDLRFTRRTSNIGRLGL